MSHPNIIKVYGFFEDFLNLYIIMECALDGHLSDFIKKIPKTIPESETAIIFHQICSAVSQMHSLSIIHRDLKP
jgi:serine/threonine protein kinase